MAKNKNKPPKVGSGIAAAVVPAVEAESTTSGGASSSQQQESDPLLDGEEEEEEEEELELLQLDLGDMIKMKQVLDESVAGALLENQHLPEDYIWDNWKLAIMFMACCFAMMAQFTPIPFPESRPVLGICGSLYFVLSGVLQLMATLVDRDAILWTRPVVVVEDDATDKKKFKNKDLMKYGLKVRSDMPRFSEYYTVIIEFQIPKGETKSGDPAKPPRCVQQKWSVGQFFDKEGYFDEVGLTMEIDKLFERFDQGKYDTMDASNKAKKE